MPLSAELRDQISEFTRSLQELGSTLKWVDPALYHLTLQFLGEVKEANGEILKESLAKLESRAPFTLRLGNMMTLPSGPTARILALALDEGFDELKALAKAVTILTRDHGIPREKRSFRAHLTLARLRRGERMAPELIAGEMPTPSWPAWEVDAFHLYQSILRPSGPVYSSRLRVDLKG